MSTHFLSPPPPSMTSIPLIEGNNQESKMSTITKVAIGALVVFIATIVTVPTCLAVFTVATPALIGIIVPSLFITFISGGICGSWVYQTVQNWLKEDDVSNIFSSTVVDDVDAMEGVSPELKAEIAQVAHGIPNPSCNCFMNAMLQNMFSFDDLSKYFVEKLDQIAKDESLAKTNLCAFDPALVNVEKPTDDMSDEDYKAYKAQQIALIKPWDLIDVELTSIEDVIEAHFSSKEKIDQFYMGISVKDAASYALAIINKWRSKKDLSYEEAQLLRVALIKVMNLRMIINIKKPATKDSKVEVDKKIPGIDHGIRIDSNRQECPGDFFTSLIESLENLTKSSSPSKIKIEKKLETPGSSSSPVITNEGIPILRIRIETSGSEVDLADFPALFAANTSDAGDKMDLPEQSLIMQAGLPDLEGKKLKKIKFKFSDEENLRIHFPVSEMNKTEKTYELKSFVVHTGKTPYFGHYINYTKITRDDGTNYWICQDDSVCFLTSVDTVKSILNGTKKQYGPAILTFKKI